MEMIQYICDHDYDIVPDYTNRTIRIWELISNNLKFGYDRNLYTNMYFQPTVRDLDYYRSSRAEAIGWFIILLVLTLIGIVWLTSILYVNLILHPKKLRAEIEVAKAKADRIILEASVKKIPDEVDALERKYLDGDK